MGLYQKSGYVDIEWIWKQGLTMSFLVGPRGTGKTYTALKFVVENNIPFFLMRRTQGQADLIGKPEFTPFKSVCADTGWDIVCKPVSKYNSAIYKDGQETPIGYTGALSTMSNVRGFDAADVKVLIYDEFIPEKHERPIKAEGAAYLNAYETINRNRELKGQEPLKVLALANSNNLANPIFMELGLIKRAESMRQRRQQVHINKDRGLGLFLLYDSPISDAKRDTALYRIAQGTDFAAMALDNDFTADEPVNAISRPLREYVPVVGVGEITVYQHKSNSRYYVTMHRQGTPPVYTSGEFDVSRFSIAYRHLVGAYYDNLIDFETYVCELQLKKYLQM